MSNVIFGFKQSFILLPKLLVAFAMLLLITTTAGAAEPADKTFHFSISPRDLSPALLAFSETTSISLLVARSDIGATGKVAVNGTMTPAAALQILLAGSGMGFKFIDGETVSISKSHVLLQSAAEEYSESSHPDQAAIPDEVAPIEETIVSARRRDEQLQKIPIPVSVLDARLIDASGIQNLQDIAQRVPGLNVSYFSIGQPSIHMRGIGSNDDGAALDNSVVIFLDDIYVGRISTIDINVLDLERIEVLRGPQGTLYGKNAIGGAVNMVSALPTEASGAQFSAGVGNLGYQSVSGKLSGPLVPKALLGRLSVSSRKRDGWQDNLILGGEKQHDDSNLSARAKLLFTPRDDLDWYMAYDFSKDKLNSSGRVPVVGRVALAPAGETDAAGSALKLPTELFAELGGDPRNATNGILGYTDRRIRGFTNRVNLERPNYRLTSITGYRNSDFEWLEDSTGLPETVIALPISDYVNEAHKQFSQELRWSSQDTGNINYVLGLYYLREETDRKEHFNIGGNIAKTHQQNTSDSFAVFGEASYSINEATKLTLGARYTYDSKELRQQSTNGGSPAIILEDFTLSSSANWRDVSPSASLSHQVSDKLMFFGRIARGFKNGGFQGAPSTREAAMREIDPETALDYELGLKSLWYRDTVQLNIASFYTNYNDLQVTQFKTVDNFGIFETSNAGSANLKGIETEFIFKASDSLELSGNYAWLDARYNQFNDVQGRDFSGNRLRQAPQHSVSLRARYLWALNPGDLSLYFDYRYQSRSYQEPDNEVTVMPSFDLLDTRLNFTSRDSNWEISLWAKNLLDEQYITHLYLLGGNDYALFGTPRTLGVSLRYSTL